MLVLSRNVGESLMIGDSIEVRVLNNHGKDRRRVKLGIIADRSVTVRRAETIGKEDDGKKKPER